MPQGNTVGSVILRRGQAASSVHTGTAQVKAKTVGQIPPSTRPSRNTAQINVAEIYALTVMMCFTFYNDCDSLFTQAGKDYGNCNKQQTSKCRSDLSYPSPPAYGAGSKMHVRLLANPSVRRFALRVPLIALRRVCRSRTPRAHSLGRLI
jgi:hypothetical protein